MLKLCASILCVILFFSTPLEAAAESLQEQDTRAKREAVQSEIPKAPPKEGSKSPLAKSRVVVKEQTWGEWFLALVFGVGNN